MEPHRGLEGDGGVESGMFTIDDRGSEGEVVFPGEGTGEDVGASCPDDGSCGYVPPIMFFGIGASPTDISGDQIGRCAPFPTVTTLEKGGSLKGYGGVGRGKRVVVAVVGTFFFDGVF